jgi:acyl dehydratase
VEEAAVAVELLRMRRRGDHQAIVITRSRTVPIHGEVVTNSRMTISSVAMVDRQEEEEEETVEAKEVLVCE